MGLRFILFREEESIEGYRDIQKILRRIKREKKIPFYENGIDEVIKNIFSKEPPILRIEKKGGECNYIFGEEEIKNYLLAGKYHNN